MSYSNNDSESVIADGAFHKRVSNVRNTRGGIPTESAQRALELLNAKQAENLTKDRSTLKDADWQSLSGSDPGAAMGDPCFCSQMTEEELEVYALCDPTLPVYKFRYILGRLRSELLRAARYGHTTCVMIITIDGFNSLENQYGSLTETVQEDILRAASQRYGAIIRRDIDLLGRYLNERFIVVLPETQPDSAALLARRLMGAIEGIVLEHKWHKVRFSVSIGVSSVVGNEISAEELVMKADMAAEAAEKEGGNRFLLV